MHFLLVFLLLISGIIAFGQDSVTVIDNTNQLNSYTIFLRGEYHERTAENERSTLLLTQYLYAHNNVRYLVFEWGPDFSYLANSYLLTRNDSILFKSTLVFSKAFWDTIALRNLAAPAADRIKIAGFDFNRSVFTGRALHKMTNGRPPLSDTAVRSAIENIIKWEGIKWSWDVQKKFVVQMKALQTLCKDRHSDLQTYFGDDWPSFLAIVNHDVESTPMVKRDKKTIAYVKDFLSKKGEGNVLFNLGVNHTFLDGAGTGNLLDQDKRYREKVCVIYPYYRIPDAEKEKYQQEQDENLPTQFLAELQTVAAYSLINIASKGIYQKEHKKTQWVYVIPKVKLP